VAVFHRQKLGASNFSSRSKSYWRHRSWSVARWGLDLIADDIEILFRGRALSQALFLE
jgi:hypothetical protein